MNHKASLFVCLFGILEFSLLATSLPVQEPLKLPALNEPPKKDDQAVRLTMKSFDFPNAANDQCFRVVYLLELPLETLEALNSNQTINIDQMLPITQLPNGVKLPALKFFDGFDAMFIRSCLESLTQHMEKSMPEFEVVGGKMAQFLGLKPLIVRVKEIKPVENGFEVTANLCFQSINSDEKSKSQDIDEKKNRTVTVAKHSEIIEIVPLNKMTNDSIDSTTIEPVYNLPTDPPSGSKIKKSAEIEFTRSSLPLVSERQNLEMSIDWPELVAALIVFVLIMSLCGCFCYC